MFQGRISCELRPSVKKLWANYIAKTTCEKGEFHLQKIKLILYKRLSNAFCMYNIIGLLLISI